MALAAVAAAEYGYGKQTIDYSHVPYYNVEWESLGEGKGYGDNYGKDSYGEELRYRQKETRSKDETKTMWAVIKASLASAANATAEDTDAKPRAICNALEFLLNRVGAMRIDAAKRPPAPHLCGH